MNPEVEKLKSEIELLKKRINSLEGRENRRRAFKYFKMIIKICLIGLILFGIWRGYDYMVNGIPNIIEEKISDLNPFKKK